MTPVLVGAEGLLAGERIALGAPYVTFGRAPANTVVIRSMDVSRFHAELRREPSAGHLLRDRGSRNGTFVNGEPIESRLLRPGDLIAFGAHTFRFEVPDPRETWRTALSSTGLTQPGKLADTPGSPSDGTAVGSAPAQRPDARCRASSPRQRHVLSAVRGDGKSTATTSRGAVSRSVSSSAQGTGR